MLSLKWILGLIVSAFRINLNVVGTPTTLAGMTATQLRRTAWDKQMQENAVRSSVFTQLKTGIKIVNKEISIESRIQCTRRT